ncbi:HalD/BesD family halogenase [Streptomyces sp. NPDC004126]|uniref:HalD/BesD family halogenase n=1 Tax=Streptomyces sp. NPDC004126 TaxID=3390695 RepID=UPI003CFBC824
MSHIEASWTSYLTTFDDQLDDLKARFAEDEFIEFPDFGPREVREALDREIVGLLDKHGLKRRINVSRTGGTPRFMEVVGRNPIAEESELIPGTYHSAALRSFLAEITKAGEILPVPFTPEEMVISRLTEIGETHGWHWDDYSYAFVWIVEGPAPEDGGALEYVRDTAWNKEDPRVEEVLAGGRVERRHPATGSAYLLKADTALHRVAPLAREGARRVILCFSYASPGEMDKAVDHTEVDFYSA